MTSPDGAVDRVAISVVHYGDAKLTALAVRSWVDQCRFSIIVVSNGPSSESSRLKAMLSEDPQMHRVRFVETPVNMGYGAAHNIAIDIARAEGATWLILANNDLTPRLASQDALCRELAHLPQHCALAGCVIDDGGRIVEGGGHLQLLFARSSIGTMKGNRSFVHGALMVLRLAENVRFDEAFFLFFEDLDMSLRLRQRDRVFGLLRELSAAHVGGATTGSTDAVKGRGDVVSFHAARSAVLLYRKRFPFLVPLAVLWRLSLALILALHNRSLAGVKGVWSGATCSRTRAAWRHPGTAQHRTGE